MSCGVASCPARAKTRLSLAANGQHGKRREPGDLRKAYRIAVRHGLCAGDDAEAVRALLGCTDRWARTLTQAARDAAKFARDAEIARLAAQGRSERQIATETGIPRSTVQRAIGGPERKPSVSGHSAAEPTTIYSAPGTAKSNNSTLFDDPDDAPARSPFAELANPASARWSELLNRLPSRIAFLDPRWTPKLGKVVGAVGLEPTAR